MSFRSNIFGQNSNLFGEITDLAAVDIYGKGAELFFTPPWSTYTISHYVVFLDGIEHENITAVDCVIDLVPENSHQVYIQPVDVNGNIGRPSNTITINTPIWQTFLFDNFPDVTGVFSLMRRTSSATLSIRVQRLSDTVETDVFLPASGFISLSSDISAGGTLAAWAGTNEVRVVKFYNQKPGGIDLEVQIIEDAPRLINSLGELELSENNLFPIIRVDWLSYLEGFSYGLGATFNSGNHITEGTQILAYSAWKYKGAGKVTAFGNYSGSLNKSNWQIGDDNSFRFYGGAIIGTVQPVNTNLRLSFKEGAKYTDYVNGQTNFYDAIMSNSGNTLPTYHIGSTASGDEIDMGVTEGVIFLTSKKRIRRLIEQQMNLTYNTF